MRPDHTQTDYQSIEGCSQGMFILFQTLRVVLRSTFDLEPLHYHMLYLYLFLVYLVCLFVSPVKSVQFVNTAYLKSTFWCFTRIILKDHFGRFTLSFFRNAELGRLYALMSHSASTDCLICKKITWPCFWIPGWHPGHATLSSIKPGK